MKGLWIVVLLSLSLLTINLLFREKSRNDQILSYDTSLNNEVAVLEHSSRLFDSQFFDQAYEKGGQYKKDAEKKVLGGIIPHHLLAAPLIAAFFDGIENQKVDTVILLGPDHFNRGLHNISVSNAKWNTFYGYLLPDLAKIYDLEQDGAIFVDEEVFENEHSIFGITPFIKRAFPKARFVPIVLGA
jgi:AmmeMemoRadiSam system protein B